MQVWKVLVNFIMLGIKVYIMDGITGKIISVEENWLKVQERDSVRMVNGDMIRDIKIMPSKYQK